MPVPGLDATSVREDDQPAEAPGRPGVDDQPRPRCPDWDAARRGEVEAGVKPVASGAEAVAHRCRHRPRDRSGERGKGPFSAR